MEKDAHTLALLMQPNVEWLVTVHTPATSAHFYGSTVLLPLILLSHFILSIVKAPWLPAIYKHMHSENRHEAKANDRSSSLRTPYLNYPTFTL